MKRNFLKMRALIFAGALLGCSLAGQIAYAEEESFAAAENILEADPVYVGESITIEEEPVIEFDGTISDAEQICQYTYTAPRDGRYYFSVTNVKQNCSVRFNLYDSLGNNICSSAGKMVQLEESETYTIQIEQRSGNTNFTVQIQQQKPSTDITNITEIIDQITFSSQKNVYLYTAPLGGYYQFYLSDITANVSFKLLAWDSYGTEIIDATTGENTSVKLEGGETYEIQVRQSNGIGKYTLNVKAQKPALDISGYSSIVDSLEYRNQENVYYFTAPVSGKYEFRFENFHTGFLYCTDMYSDDRQLFQTQFHSYEGDSYEEVSLEEGMTYEISILAKSGSSSFTLNIDYPASAQQYLDDFSNGKIEEAENNELNKTDKETIESDNENSSSEDYILQQLESLQSEMDELKDENEMLKNALDANEIEYE